MGSWRPEGQDTFGFSRSRSSLLRMVIWYFVLTTRRRWLRREVSKSQCWRLGRRRSTGRGAAVQYLVDQGLTDPARVAIGGTSHGATMMHYAVTKLQGCGSRRSPMRSRKSRHISGAYQPEFGNTLGNQDGGTPEESPKPTGRQHHSRRSEDQGCPPHPIRNCDPQLPPYESEQLIQALKKANKPSSLTLILGVP